MSAPSKEAFDAANQINYSWGIGDYDENKSMPEAVAAEIQKAIDIALTVRDAAMAEALKRILEFAQKEEQSTDRTAMIAIAESVLRNR